ncbi:MAG: HipA domain-containing protein [Actinomycetia bacterium]|nr:HipA domain-containing protein [Actinomycetes bacterium]
MSESPSEAYVWTWLPGADEPVVAGRIEAAGSIFFFNYGQSFLRNTNAVPLYEPELPLRSGQIRPLASLEIAGCFSDASPDAWGQRVVMHRLLGSSPRDVDPAQLSPLTYLLESGSDRIGALDFQTSATEYIARGGAASLEELLQAAERVESGVPFSMELDGALLHGSSIGGARPKALLNDGDRKLIAKFSSSMDSYPIVKGEYAAMALAHRVGLDVARVELVQALGKDVLIVERFDRGWGTNERRSVISALTILELGEMFARYATYPDLADQMRSRFVGGDAAARELFSRIVFNILVGNTDDHARNHAAFWDGRDLELTPAYDICPQLRAGGETAQAMAIGRDGFRLSQLAGCVKAAAEYLLSESEARLIIDHQVEVIEAEWSEVADDATMTEADRQYFLRRQFLNPFAFEGY